MSAVTGVAAGHTLSLTSPEAAAAMNAFMTGSPVSTTITVDIPDFAGE